MSSSKEQSVQRIPELLDRYELYAEAAGFSNAQVSHMERGRGYSLLGFNTPPLAANSKVG
jgi:hypothetical protein